MPDTSPHSDLIQRLTRLAEHFDAHDEDDDCRAAAADIRAAIALIPRWRPIAEAPTAALPIEPAAGEA